MRSLSKLAPPGLFGMGKELYSFGTIPNELAGGSSVGALLRDSEVREEANRILLEARAEVEELLEREEIEKLFDELEAEEQSSTTR